MRFEVRRLHDAFRYTTVYVTHDQSEAMTTADVICVMNLGKIEQAGSPEDIYDRPRSEFVARFIGMSNVFKGKALDDDRVSIRRRAAALSPASRSKPSADDRGVDPPAPDRAVWPTEPAAKDNVVPAKVVRQVFLGIEPRLYGRGSPTARSCASSPTAERERRAGRDGLAASAAANAAGRWPDKPNSGIRNDHRRKRQ